MKIEGGFRSTGMGAYHGTKLLVGKEWMPIYEVSSVRYLGRHNGVNEYSLDVDDDAIWARFYRSNSGKEDVTIHKGQKQIKEFHSFSEADRWAANEKEPEYCPLCGRRINDDATGTNTNPS